MTCDALFDTVKFDFIANIKWKKNEEGEKRSLYLILKDQIYEYYDVVDFWMKTQLRE